MLNWHNINIIFYVYVYYRIKILLDIIIFNKVVKKIILETSTLSQLNTFKHIHTLENYISYFSFTLYPAYSRVGRGDLGLSPFPTYRQISAHCGLKGVTQRRIFLTRARIIMSAWVFLTIF